MLQTVAAGKREGLKSSMPVGTGTGTGSPKVLEFTTRLDDPDNSKLAPEEKKGRNIDTLPTNWASDGVSTYVPPEEHKPGKIDLEAALTPSRVKHYRSSPEILEQEERPGLVTPSRLIIGGVVTLGIIFFLSHFEEGSKSTPVRRLDLEPAPPAEVVKTVIVRPAAAQTGNDTVKAQETHAPDREPVKTNRAVIIE